MDKDIEHIITQVTCTMLMKQQATAQSYELIAWANIINAALRLDKKVKNETQTKEN